MLSLENDLIQRYNDYAQHRVQDWQRAAIKLYQTCVLGKHEEACKYLEHQIAVVLFNATKIDQFTEVTR